MAYKICFSGDNDTNKRFCFKPLSSVNKLQIKNCVVRSHKKRSWFLISSRTIITSQTCGLVRTNTTCYSKMSVHIYKIE